MFFISTTNDRTVNRMVNSLCRHLHERDENGATAGGGWWVGNPKIGCFVCDFCLTQNRREKQEATFLAQAVKSEYLPMIQDLEVPQGIEDEISSVWGDMVAAKEIRYYDRSGVEKRAREEMGDL